MFTMITKPPFGQGHSQSLPNARSALNAFLTASNGSTIYHDATGKEMEYEELNAMAEQEWREIYPDA